MTYDPHRPYQPDPDEQGYQVPVVPSGPPVSPTPYGYQYPPQQQGPVYQQVVVAQGPPVSGWSVTALIFGILGVLGGFCLFGIPCLIAVICGHAGLVEAKNGKGGRGMAIAGLVMGYLFVGPAIFVLVTGGIGSAFS
jgi:hypothetical protein